MRADELQTKAWLETTSRFSYTLHLLISYQSILVHTFNAD